MYEYYPLGVNWEFDEYVSFTGDMFQRFIDIIFEKADAFSLTSVQWSDCGDKKLENALVPYEKKQYQMKTWYGYSSEGMSTDELPDKKIHVYEASEETKNILLTHMDDLFFNKLERGKLVEQELSLEDINFFKDSKWLLGTVSHERMATLYNTDSAFDGLIQEIGNWQEVKDAVFLNIADFE